MAQNFVRSISVCLLMLHAPAHPLLRSLQYPRGHVKIFAGVGIYTTQHILRHPTVQRFRPKIRLQSPTLNRSLIPSVPDRLDAPAAPTSSQAIPTGSPSTTRLLA